MDSPLFLVSLVETLNKLGELVWYAFIDDIRVHCAQLLAELVLDIRTQPALLPLHLVGSHAHGRVRRLPHLLVHLTRPPVQTPMWRDSRIPGWYNAWAIQMGRAPKKRKALVLIGIVCDDEIKDIIDLKSPKEKSKMVK